MRLMLMKKSERQHETRMVFRRVTLELDGVAASCEHHKFESCKARTHTQCKIHTQLTVL